MRQNINKGTEDTNNTVNQQTPTEPSTTAEFILLKCPWTILKDSPNAMKQTTTNLEVLK